MNNILVETPAKKQVEKQLKLITNRYAFLVGIDDYAHVSPLQTPVSDINAIEELLRSEYAYNVYTSEDDTLREKSLEDLFEKSLIEKLGNIPEDSQVLIYFAGHGYAQDSEDGMKGYLIPKKGRAGEKDTWYSMTRLMEVISKLPTRHLLLVMDCCFGGSFRYSGGYRAIGRGNLEKLFKQHYQHFTSKPSWQVLTSTAPNQEAIDFLDHGLQGNHSPFAHLFIQGLTGITNLNPSGVITCAELYSYLQQKLPGISSQLGVEQNVGLFPFPSGKHQNGEYLFPKNGFNPNQQLTERQYNNPYKGLKSYDQEDEQMFFGRTKAIKKLEQHIEKHNFTLVTGASGTGKSSLVKAGIVPKLIKSENIVIVKEPGRQPEDELKSLNGFDYLVIDQLEQLITQSEENQRAGFWNTINDFLQSGKKIIATVRIDFEKQLDLSTVGETGRFVIPPFSPEELREIIITPALRVGRFIEPLSLVDKIVKEVILNPGSLPLLSFTMEVLFEKCKQNLYRNILEKDYDELNGVTGALTMSADNVFTNLTPAEQITMRHLMLRMVVLSGGETAGKKVFDSELVFDDDNETRRVGKVKRELFKARLIQSNNTKDKEAYIEPSHDALVRVWGRMRGWIKDFGEEKILLLERLDGAVNDYNKRNQSVFQLWYLSPYRRQVIKSQNDKESIPTTLNKAESKFIRSSTNFYRVALGIIIGVVLTIAGLAISNNRNAKEANNNLDTANENLKFFRETERTRLDQELKPLLGQVEIFNVAEEHEMALRICDTIETRVDSINSITHILRDTFKANIDLDSLSKLETKTMELDSLLKLEKAKQQPNK